jgi:heavy metal sensor kinase
MTARRPLSIRHRLTLWYTGVLLVILLATSALAYAGLRRALMQDVDASLVTVARVVAEHGGEPELPADQIARDFFGTDIYDKFFRLLDPRGSAAAPSWGRDSQALRLSPAARENAARGASTFETLQPPGRAAVRVLTVPVVRRGAVVRLVQVGMDLERTQRALTAFVHTLIFLVPLGVGLAVAGGMVIARRALAPVDEMSRAARRITAENLTGRIEPPGAADEMDRLAETLNGMLARLDAAFGHLRRFAADAAHELRTPLTVLKGGLEVALRTDRSAAEYRAVLASSLQEVEGLIRLTEDLLLFSRATAGLEGPRARLELEPIVLEVAEVGVRLAKPGGVTMRLGAVQPAAVVGDAASLRRALLNLVENAVRYSDAGGAVELTLTQGGGYAEIVVSDSGPGLAPADAERIFEPFVRLDAGRARYAGGTGLGLAIARSIVTAHGGTLTVDSAPGAGARFTVRLLLV